MAKNRSGQDVLKALQGEWRLVYHEIEGEMTPVAEVATIRKIFVNQIFQVEKGGKLIHEGKFSVNVNVTPHEIVLIYSKGPDVFLGGPRAGILQLEGDTLKLCFAAVGHRPPEAFSTFPDSEAVLSISQRAGSEAGKGPTHTPTKFNWCW